MPELRKDPITGTWVIISPERRKRPRYFRPVSEEDSAQPANCPFCEGNEALTPPELLAFRRPGSAANKPGWEVRVIPNKYPALRVEGTLDKRGDGCFDRMSGIGAHEVIIETPHHSKGLAELPPENLEKVLLAFRARIRDLKNDIRFRYIMIFKNHGPSAGATLAHSHSQLIALPVVPLRVKEELEGAAAHFRVKERCIFCDILRYESEQEKRVLLETRHFTVLAPYAPRFSFELAIYPKRHDACYENCREDELQDLAQVLNDVLRRYQRILNQPDYNLIVHNAPLQKDLGEHFHWHMELMPMLSRTAGFEWGTGFYINPVPPEEAVQALKTM